jgi:hypothetical protein
MTSNPLVFPYKPRFSAATLIDWVEAQHPITIGINDSQYAWYADQIAKECRKDVNGIPIRFLGPST